MKKIIVWILFLPLLFSFQRTQENFSSKHFLIKKLAPGVWAAIANDNYGHAICNAGIIDLGDKTLIFDPFMNIDAANDLKLIAETLTKRKIQLVINSHFHNDHIRGNQVFDPGTTIISTTWTKNQQGISEPEERAWEKQNAAKKLAAEKEKLKIATGAAKEELKMWVGYYEGIVNSEPLLKMALPNSLFDDSLWIHGSKRSVELKECKNGHTGSDAILLLPKEGIVFTGDILFVKRHPWFGDGNPESLQKHLEKLEADKNYSVFVPGHGPVGGRKEITELINYIKALRQLVKDGIYKNQPDSVIIKTDIPELYKDWWYGRFYQDNLQFLCDELRKK